ncbi:MAG: hypothetical protein OEV48_20860 [Acidobacteriota bacterium]|nr:hypothetical protein [Acidobacteriota bacterium]
MSNNRLTAEELTNLVKRVFEPRAEDKALAVIVDLPDDVVPDTERWRERRALAAGWVKELLGARSDHGLEISLFLYPNVHSNNADLPSSAWRWTDYTIPDHIEDMTGQLEEPMEQVLSSHQLVMAPTQFSTTAPLKMMAPRLGFRGATMPGFSSAMVPALRLDYTEINRRVWFLKDLLDDCVGADFHFVVDDSKEYQLHLDLRHRKAHASGGLPSNRAPPGTCHQARPTSFPMKEKSQVTRRQAAVKCRCSSARKSLSSRSKTTARTGSPAPGPSPKPRPLGLPRNPRVAISQSSVSASSQISGSNPSARSCWTKSSASTSPLGGASILVVKLDPTTFPVPKQ